MYEGEQYDWRAKKEHALKRVDGLKLSASQASPCLRVAASHRLHQVCLASPCKESSLAVARWLACLLEVVFVGGEELAKGPLRDHWRPLNTLWGFPCVQRGNCDQ